VAAAASTQHIAAAASAPVSNQLPSATTAASTSGANLAGPDQKSAKVAAASAQHIAAASAPVSTQLPAATAAVSSSSGADLAGPDQKYTKVAAASAQHITAASAPMGTQLPAAVSISGADLAGSGSSLVGKRVAREFDDGVFFGSIKEYCPVGTIENADFDVWYVEYDDGDDADYDIVNIQAMLTLYEKEMHCSPDEIDI